MWWLLTLIFEISISLFIIIYLKRVNSVVSSVYSKEMFNLFIKYSWTIGLFTVIGTILRLFRSKDNLNSQDTSYQFHNLASSSVQYIKLNLDQKINFLIFMLVVSTVFLFFYGLLFILVLLPFRTLVLVVLTQIFGFDFAGFIEQITSVYIPSFNLWLHETFGLSAPQIPRPSWSDESINRIHQINQIHSEVNRINQAVSDIISTKDTAESLTNSVTPNFIDTHIYTTVKVEYDWATICLFTFGTICILSGGLIYFDHGPTLYSSVTTVFNYTGGIVYNTGGFIYNTGASIFNSISGFFHTTNVVDSTSLIDPDTPSASSGISRYFGQGDNPASPTPSSSSLASTSTAKPSGLLVDTKVEPSSSLLTARSNN